MRIIAMILLELAMLNAMAQSAPTVAGDTNNPVQAVVGRAREDKHILEPGEIISFQILEDKKPPISLVVTDSGEVHVPILGRVDASGKTCQELAASLKALFEKDYFYRATVIVGLDTMNKPDKMVKVIGHVLIWGEVHSQGSIDLLAGHPLTISEAILRVGGVTENADKKKVKIIRSDGHGSTRMIEVNVFDIMEKGKTEKNITVEPNDYIIVLPRLIRF